VQRTLRSLCRCDGLKDAAVVATLVVLAGALATRLLPAGQVVTPFC
jgi:hypothetical protein